MFMKKIFYLLAIISFMLPVSTYALTGDISINCNTTSVKVGEEIKCSVSGSSDGQVSELFANVSATGSILIEKFRAERIWNVITEWPNLSLISNDKKPGVFEIGTVYLKASSVGTGTFSMTGITFTGDNGDTVSISNKSVSVNVISDNPVVTPEPDPVPEVPVKSSDSSLKSLNVSAGSISFNPSVLEYNIEVSSNVSSIKFEAVPNDSKANVKLPDNLSLKTGENSFSIVVTAEDGNTTTYKVVVNKLETVLSDNALLKELIIDGYDIDFSSDVFEYNLGNINKSQLNITANPVDSNSSVKIFGNSSISSDSAIIVQVTSQSGNSKNYIIYVNNPNYKGESNSFNDLMLIIISALFAVSAIIIVILLLGRNKYKKKLEKKLEEDKKRLELLEVELKNKLAMIPPEPEKKEDIGAMLLNEKQEDPLEGIDPSILEKREEDKKENDAVEDAPLEEVLEEKEEEKLKEEKTNPGEDARDILPPEVEEVVNSKNLDTLPVVEEVKEEILTTEISADEVASVVKKKKVEEVVVPEKKDKKKNSKKKEK